MPTDIATHEHPSRGERANFLIFSFLNEGGLAGAWEQLWARQVKEGEFEICCIPYFAYGIALGDVVRTAPAHGKTYVIAGVVGRAGRRVLRLWLKEASGASRDRVRAVVIREALLCEWRSENLVAVDLPNGPLPPDLGCLLDEAADLGILVEWAA